MQPICRLLAVVGFCLLSCLHARADSSVEQLGSADFEKFVSSNKLVLVSFCNPSERVCKRLSHEFSTAAKDSADQKLKFASVDCVKSKDVCDKYNVSQYPTVLPFESGSPVDTYVSKKLKASVINAIAEEFKKPPVVKKVDSEDDVKTFMGLGTNLVAFTNTEDDDCVDVFKAVADRPPVPASFAIAPAEVLPKVWDSAKSKSGPTILLKAPYQKAPVAFNEKECSFDALTNFIKLESFPLVGAISNTNYNQYLNRGLPLVWCFLQSNDQLEDNLAILEKAAVGSKGKLSWVWLDADSFSHHASAMGLSGDKWPGVVIDNQKEKKKYVLPADTDFTSAALADFSSKVLSGQIAPTLKSQEIPSDDSAALKTVVGKNYNEIVIESDSDVFLMVHAHWCGHCQRAMPRINETAQLFDKVDNIVVAAIDADLNDVPIDYQGFPTIYFLPAGKKDKPISFSGDRNVQGFSSFILEHATKSLSSSEKESLLEQAKKADEQLDNPKPESTADADKDEL